MKKSKWMVTLGTMATVLPLVDLIAQNSKRPNIVYIFTDQQWAGAMSCSGNSDLKTPNMDFLASQGVRFTNAYCAMPLSTPSRAAMMTGVPPGRSENLINGTSLKQPYATNTLGNILSKSGYDCVYGGKWHLPDGLEKENSFGFRQIAPQGDNELAQKSADFLKEKHDKPFFLVLSFDNPHNICEYARRQNLPYLTLKEPSLEQCPNLPANFAVAPFDADILRVEQSPDVASYPTARYSVEDWRRYRNAYYRLVEHVDMEIGKVIRSLQDQKLMDNTLIIFSSDHGDGNGAHQWNQKSALYEETTNIPFIVRLPKAKSGGQIKNQLINNGVDLYATICDYAQVQMPEYCQGRSLKPILEGISESFNEYVVVETFLEKAKLRGWAVRTKDYKYVNYESGLYREQLYDMNSDRGEMINLAIEERYQTILNEHRKLLVNWHKQNKVPTSKRATPILN